MTFDTTQSSYRSLRNIVAERTNGIVFWTGSGLSAQAGLPTWVEFKTHLLAALYEQINQLDDSESKELRRSAQLIQNEENNWRAFEMLRNSLGETSWRSSVREILRTSASADSPSVYEKIWRLGPHGLLTLNLDRLATKAYTKFSPGTALTEFVGNRAANYGHVLKNPYPFVCHLHGDIDDVSSWTLTSSQLNRQRNDPGYQTFLTTCLSAKTIVFLGISVDDIAVGGFVEQLSGLNIDVGEHYWVTSRRDLMTNQWAEERGIRLIRYDVQEEDHMELLEALDDLVNFVSVDDSTDLGPIIPEGLSPADKTLPAQSDLLMRDAEEIRKALNQEATRLLDSPSPDATEQYESFSNAYDEAIYRAWYTSAEPLNNQLLGHMLHEEIARGAFGKVYRASDPDGETVAVKVLHEEMRRNEDLFQAFRRGVRSMKILRNRRVEGMVPYRKAFEIPAFVAMDWIDGPDLGEAVSSTQVSDWELILRIGLEIVDIVRSGHLLPERVLHRDIRPSNVMLRGFYTESQNWDVVVLDFDLSWHKGALERSVTHGSALLGYLAPEQIQDLPGISTRHAAVDSFGLGMVLFFMLSGEDPVPDQHQHGDWADTLDGAASQRPCDQWVSTPKRFARLIESATLHGQSERWDMTQIQAELQRLREAVLYPESTEGGRRVSVLKRRKGAPVHLG